MISTFFIKRPIFACVISIIILLLGLVSYEKLPIAQFPDIVPPTVMVKATYPGASAEDVINSVAIPIEEEVNGVDNMLYMSSTCSSDGSMALTVTFEVGTDPDMATVLVQNRVNIASPRLPPEVTRQGVTVKKRSTNMVLVLNLIEKEADDPKNKRKYTENEIADKTLYLANYTSRNIMDRLGRVRGVGEVNVFNSQDFSMRIDLDPAIMAARGLSVQDVSRIIQEQNVQVSAGRIGSPPIPIEQLTNYALVTRGRLSDVSEFEEMVVLTDEQGGLLKLKDIATVHLGGLSYSSSSSFNGIPTCTTGIYQLPGANSLDVAKAVQAEIALMEGDFERDGLEFKIGYDATQFVEVSIHEVKETLYIAIILVIGIVYLFLQDWRAALIPTLTIPVSLVGTFFMMNVLEFSINSLTLFGLILVIGIVVDDAIVVIENTQRLIDDEGLDSESAAIKSMSQVSGPIIATTCVLMSVFGPTIMIAGIVGKMYQQFALTIAGAVLISALCALTFAPALAAILLRKSVAPEKKFFVFRIFNFFFDAFASGYLWFLKRIIRTRIFVLVFWCAIVYSLSYGFTHLPSGFIPDEDQGAFFADIRLPEGATLERTRAVLERMQEIIDEDNAGIHNTITIAGFSMLDSTSSTNKAMLIMRLEPWEERSAAKGTDLPSLYAKLSQKFATIQEAEIFLFTPPPIAGLGTSSGVQFQLLDTTGRGIQDLFETTQDLMAVAMETPELGLTTSTFDPNAPRLQINIDRDKLKQWGIPLSEPFAALQTYYGSLYVNDFNEFDRIYRVTVMADGQFRRTPDDVLSMMIKHPNGTMVPMRAFATVDETVGPQLLFRYNLYPTSNFTARIPATASTGQGIAALQKIERESLPEGYKIDWTGMTYQEQHAGSSTMLVFGMSIVFAFLVLAAQYESWSTPIIIMMAVPLGVGGAFLAVALRGLDLNIYTQIGLILMVGLSAKNAILITEFAVEKRRDGEPIDQSAYEAGRLRLRPIMMTSYAFILGIFPLVIATGAGAASRHAIGTAVFGGMLTETMVGIFVTPVLFVVLQSTAEMLQSMMNKFLGKKSQPLENKTD